MSTISQPLPAPLHRHRAPEAQSSQSATTGPGTAAAAASPLAAEADSTLAGGDADAAALDPSSLRDRIDGLLARQVQSGTLTNAQADTLKGAFGPPDGGQGIDAGDAVQGLPPSPPQHDAGGAASAAPGGGARATPSTEELLASFVKQLQSSQPRSHSYGADGARTGEQVASSLLLNFRA